MMQELLLGDSLLQEGIYIYIPCKGTDLGYLCVMGYGVPLCYAELEEGYRRYWFGYDGVHWVNQTGANKFKVMLCHSVKGVATLKVQVRNFAADVWKGQLLLDFQNSRYMVVNSSERSDWLELLTPAKVAQKLLFWSSL